MEGIVFGGFQEPERRTLLFGRLSEYIAAEYNTIDRRRVRRIYGFDVAPVTAGSTDIEVMDGVTSAATFASEPSKRACSG
jgi:hypothetical protein